MVWSVFTVLVSPSAAVNGMTGSGCSRVRSTTSALDRHACGLPMHPAVDLLAEHLARLGELGETVVAGQQVRFRGHFGRRTVPSTGRPSSRAATYRRTVLGSTPTICAAECAHPVASNASRISMIFLSDFFTVPP
jgi:hypothetical protein